MAHGYHLDVRQIARREPQVLVDLVGDDQHAIEAHRPDLLREQPGLRLRDAEVVDHPDAVLARQLRQDRAEPRAVHLAVHFVREVLVRRIRKNLAAAAPQRARGPAGAGAARAFLPPRLLGGVVDRAAILLRARAKTRVCLERDHDLMHQRLVEVAREQRVGRVEGAGSAFVVHHFEFHGALCSALLRVGLRCRRGGLGRLRRGFRGRSLRGRSLRGLDHWLGNLDRRPHDHVAAARAGHRALDEQELPPGIDADDLQTQDRAAHVAEVAGHALAGKHARRALVLAGRAGLVMRDRVAVAGAVGREMVALDHAGETLADRDALYVHLLADLEDLDADLAADLQVGEVLRPGAELAQRVASLDTRLGEVPGNSLVDAAGAPLAERHLDRCIAVLLGALDLGHAVVGDVEHRHRLRAALVGEDARHADLAADQSYRHFKSPY